MSGICSFSLFSSNKKQPTIDFRTPKNKNYSISHKENVINSKFGSKYNEIFFHDKYHSIRESTVDYPFLHQQFYQFNTSKGGTLIIAYITNISKQKGNTLLFSHDYRTTLGDNYSFTLDIATQLKVIFI